MCPLEHAEATLCKFYPLKTTLLIYINVCSTLNWPLFFGRGTHSPSQPSVNFTPAYLTADYPRRAKCRLFVSSTNPVDFVTLTWQASY